MTFYGGAYDPQRAPGAAHQRQYMPAMHSAMHPPANAGLAGSGSHGMASQSTATYATYYQAPPSPEKPHYYAPNTPDSTTSTSSYGTDYSDSEVDAAMSESGLLVGSELSDFELMREMEELFTSPRASTSQWGQSVTTYDSGHGHGSTGHVDSPWRAAQVSPQGGHEPPVEMQVSAVPVSQASEFVPSGAGWGVKTMEIAIPAVVTEDTDMEGETSDAELSEADTMEMKLLMREIKFLEAQREFLDYRASVTENATSGALLHRRDAIEEKRKLMEAQLLKDMFTRTINNQFETLRYVQQQLLESPITHYRNTLMTPMESYIHLTKDMRERRAVLASMRDEKIDTARRFIEFQSRNIDVERDFFFLDTFEKFGKFYTVDFSISKLDDTTVEDVAFVFYFHFVFTKDRISQILGSVENREYFDGVDWEFLHGRFVDRINLLKPRRNGRNFVVQESNTVYYAKQMGDSFVMTCDNIDKDELHPYRTTGRIRKDTIFGVVVEPYVDSQGKASVLLKRFSFYRHHFNNIEPTPELMQAISTKVILWGQAVRMCVSSQENDRPPMPLSKKPLKRAGAPMVLTNW